MQSLERQVAANSAAIASVLGDMNQLEKSVAGARGQWTHAQLALLTVEGEGDGYRCRFGIEEQRCGDFEALPRGLRGRWVDHTSLVDLARSFLCQDMKRDLDVYLAAIFAAVRHPTVGLRSATSIVV